MTGTGTKAAPYIPETWDEFVTAVEFSDAYISLECDFDMNEIAPEGLTAQINIGCTQIDGNGHTIKNLYCTHDNCTFYVIGSSNLVVNSLNFTDFYRIKGYFFSNRSRTLTFNNCLFTGFLYDCCFTYGTTNFFNCCGINISGKNYQPFWISDNNYSILTNTKILLNGTGITKVQVSLNNSLLLGSFSGEGVLNLNQSSTSVVNAEITGFSSIYDMNVTNSIINSDLCEIALNSNKFTKVTTAQITDLEYMQSINFPIGSD